MSELEILEKVKVLLNIQTITEDFLLSIYISYLIQEAKNYTLNEDIENYDLVILSYTISLYRANIFEETEAVKTIKEGDTSISFGGGMFNTKQANILLDFKEELKPFRRVKAVI